MMHFGCVDCVRFVPLVDTVANGCSTLTLPVFDWSFRYVEIDIRQLTRAIRRWWWAPIVLAFALACIGFLGARMSAPSYTASTTMLVTTQIAGDEILRSGSNSQTYLSLVTSGPVLDRVILDLDIDYTREELSDLIDAQVISGTDIIRISVTTDDPQLSADIANSAATNFVITATDLSLGEIQRNLDDLRQQADTLRDRVIVIDTKLAEIDTEANANDSQIQAEIAQLERDRLQLNQTLADLDRVIRELTTSLSVMSIPVVITDFAKPSEEAIDAANPLLLALLGAFLGGLIGAAWIGWQALSDRVLRDTSQIVSQPLLAHLNPANIESGSVGDISLLVARIAGISKLSGGESLAIVSARPSEVVPGIQVALQATGTGDVTSIKAANGLLDDANAMSVASESGEAVVIATLGKTRIDDLEELEAWLAAVNTRVIGTVIIKPA